MARETYWLQYLIYTVVLHRCCGCGCRDTTTTRTSAASSTSSCAGMIPERGAATGVFHDRPSRALVEALDGWIGGATMTAARSGSPPCATPAALTDLDVHLAAASRGSRTTTHRRSLLGGGAGEPAHVGDGHVCADLAAVAGRALVDGARGCARRCPRSTRGRPRCARRRSSAGPDDDSAARARRRAAGSICRRYWRLRAGAGRRSAARAAARDDRGRRRDAAQRARYAAGRAIRRRRRRTGSGSRR